MEKFSENSQYFSRISRFKRSLTTLNCLLLKKKSRSPCRWLLLCGKYHWEEWWIFRDLVYFGSMEHTESVVSYTIKEKWLKLNFWDCMNGRIEENLLHLAFIVPPYIVHNKNVSHPLLVAFVAWLRFVRFLWWKHWNIFYC